MFLKELITVARWGKDRSAARGDAEGAGETAFAASQRHTGLKPSGSLRLLRIGSREASCSRLMSAA